MHGRSITLRSTNRIGRSERGLDTKASRQIRSHTGIRGVAALLVVAYHQEFGPFYKFPFELSSIFFRRCYLMVDLFFVLSGFIISYVYLGGRQRPLSWSETNSFLFARFARIYPLHVVTMTYALVFALASTMLLTAFGHDHGSVSASDLRDWVLQLALIQAWIPQYYAWNIPSWSISAEMFAYLLFPIVAASHAYHRRLLEAVLLAFSIAYYAYVATHGGSLDITAGSAPLRCLAGFGLGMIVYVNRATVTRLSNRVLSFLQVIAMVWAVLALAYKVADPLILPAFALVVLTTWPDRGLVSRVLSRQPFEWLGEISYSVYLVHVPVGTTLWLAWAHFEPKLGLTPPITRGIWLTISFAAVLITSSLTYRYIEVPARRWLMRSRREPPAIDPAMIGSTVSSPSLTGRPLGQVRAGR
jgi:peptidoglycan/LPS O-acetylase OafA/YrhL